MMGKDEAKIVELAYEQSQKGLGQQEARLAAIRQYSGVVGAVSALCSSLIGAGSSAEKWKM